MIKSFIDRRSTNAVRKLERRIEELETQLRAKDATITVHQVELAALAGVIERDRKRVQAEVAIQAQRQAFAESGIVDESSRDTSFRTRAG